MRTKRVKSCIVAALIVVSGWAVLILPTGSALASQETPPHYSVIHYDWAGYDGNNTANTGNDTVYMVHTASSTSPFYLQPLDTRTRWYGNDTTYHYESAVVMSAGTYGFQEYWQIVPPSYLFVEVPAMLAGGFKAMNTQGAVNDSTQLNLIISLRESNANGLWISLPGSVEDVGMNVTGMQGGITTSDLVKLLIDAAAVGMAFVPVLDIVDLATMGPLALATASTVVDLASLSSTPTTSSSPINGNGTSYEEYTIVGGNYENLSTNNVTWQDIYGDGTYFGVHIPDNAWNTTHNFSLEGQLQWNGGGPDLNNNFFNFSAVPAVTISGRVLSQSGVPVPNADVYLQSQYGVAYQVTTNQDGYYAFYGQPNVNYYIWCDYCSPFASLGYNPNPPYYDYCGNYNGTLRQDLTLTVTMLTGVVNDINGNAIKDANISVAASGKSMSTKTNDSGRYEVAIPSTGVYKVTATASGYQGETTSVNISTLSQSDYNVSFQSMTGLVNPLPKGILSYREILITNTQDTATLNPYDQKLVINSGAYVRLEATNLSNVEFFYSNGTVIPSWLESGTKYTNDTVYWLKLAGMPSYSSLTIFMGFASTSTVLFNGNSNVGEAPQLPIGFGGYYGQYDNGRLVFSFYDNFAGPPGTALSSEWTDSGISYAIDNGISLKSASSGNDGIWSASFTAGVCSYIDIMVTQFGPPQGWFETGYVSGTTSNNYGSFVQAGSNTEYSLLVYGQQQDSSGWKRNTLLSNLTVIYPFAGIYTIAPTSSTASYYQHNYGSAVFEGNDSPTYPLHVGLFKANQGSLPIYFRVSWIRVRTALPNGVMPSATLPMEVADWLWVTVTNNQLSGTSNPYQQMIAFNASAYSVHESQGLSNIEFMWANGSVVPTWLQSGSSASTNAVFWALLPGISSGSALVFKMVFVNTSVSLLNGITIGEAPQISASYAQFDDGAHVFTAGYWNFAGNSLPSGWQWTNSQSPQGSESVSDGLHFDFNSGNWYTMAIATSSSADYAQYALFAYQESSNYASQNTLIGEVTSYGGSVQSYGYASVIHGYVASMTGSSYQLNYAPGANTPIVGIASQSISPQTGTWYLTGEAWPSTGTEYANGYYSSGGSFASLSGSNTLDSFGNTHLYIGMYDNNGGGGTINYQYAFLESLPPNNVMPLVSITYSLSGGGSGGGGGGGGGGCVLYGTFITLANGTTVQVQFLEPGMRTLSYNTNTGELVASTVISVNISNVTSVVVVDGFVSISGLNDQPVFVMLENGTEEWIMLGQLNDTMQLFNPTDNLWIPVINLSVLHGNFTVYDVQTSKFFYSGGHFRSDYIANGVLLDIKYY